VHGSIAAKEKQRLMDRSPNTHLWRKGTIAAHMNHFPLSTTTKHSLCTKAFSPINLNPSLAPLLKSINSQKEHMEKVDMTKKPADLTGREEPGRRLSLQGLQRFMN
jgi:hypothetical protein